jgi:hypothetical protein
MKAIIEIPAGNPATTAPFTATTSTAAARTKPTETKVMVLAVHPDAEGKLVITPIDIEHEQDDQSELSSGETETGANMLVAYRANGAAMNKALEAPHILFDQRLYRERFRTFENFCFALLGTHRIQDATAAKAKARVERLKTALQEDEQ